MDRQTDRQTDKLSNSVGYRVKGLGRKRMPEDK